MVKSDKQEKVDFIALHLSKGKSRAEILSKFVQKWQKSDRTFTRYWKTANTIHENRQKLASKAADAAYIKAKEEAAKEAVMSKQERLELLTKIAKGEIKIKKPFVISGKIMEYPAEPDHSDRTKAIAEMNKMEGDYKPTKIAQTDVEGNDVKQVIIINGKEIEF